MIQSEASPPLRRSQIDVSRSTTGVFPTVHCRGGATQLQPFIKSSQWTAALSGSSVKLAISPWCFFFSFILFSKRQIVAGFMSPRVSTRRRSCVSLAPVKWTAACSGTITGAAAETPTTLGRKTAGDSNNQPIRPASKQAVTSSTPLKSGGRIRPDL